jgi:hypothetical protein
MKRTEAAARLLRRSRAAGAVRSRHAERLRLRSGRGAHGASAHAADGERRGAMQRLHDAQRRQLHGARL